MRFGRQAEPAMIDFSCCSDLVPSSRTAWRTRSAFKGTGSLGVSSEQREGGASR